jgi:hypothetical protein
MRLFVYRHGILDFSNTVRKSDVERLAEVDEHEVVREIQVGWSILLESQWRRFVGTKYYFY